MKQHDRDFFVSSIRSGVYLFEIPNIGLVKMVSPTQEDSYFINKEYVDTYNRSISEGLATKDEILELMREKGFWTEDDDIRIEGLEEDIENLKIRAYENRSNAHLLKHIRHGVKSGYEQLREMRSKQSLYVENTCEAIASIERCGEHIKRCALVNGEKIDPEYGDDMRIWSHFMDSVLNEEVIRELARSEPWKSTWVLRQDSGLPLFANEPGRELTICQKNILIWSKTYANIVDAHDAPDDYVVEDDLLLDGWFAYQARERKAEKGKQDVESRIKNSKISSSQEVFVMASSKEDAKKINRANDINATMVKRQRAAVIMSKGEAVDLDFQDQQLAAQREQNEQFKGRFK